MKVKIAKIVSEGWREGTLKSAMSSRIETLIIALKIQINSFTLSEMEKGAFLINCFRGLSMIFFTLSEEFFVPMTVTFR